MHIPYVLSRERFQTLEKILEGAGLPLREQIRGKHCEQQMRQVFAAHQVPPKDTEGFLEDLNDSDVTWFHENGLGPDD